ncbi:MAG: hypothetical protein ANIMEMIM_00305 [Candidatus Argoarchaeum ethanivorans]|uniref:DUF83 domain-containing protein n=1 Tax=Candidatus Argoarchaeum ethanivorans TaxID=2608793 RepID=A0A811T7R6_9EURY|nr:MAG: hypothetical protein ANIMEMIM_00305 [Candidatus Argoarchaeum ethanivorans]
MDQSHVRVSQLVSYYICPRKIYFEQTRETEVKPGLKSLLLKELSHLLPDIITDELSEEDIRQAFCDISQELPHIYPQIIEKTSPQELTACLDELDIKTIAQGLSDHIREDKKKLLLSITPYATEPILRSAKHNLTGTPNKIIKMGDELAPSLIRTGKPPENGVWLHERLSLAGYALLIEDAYDTVVNRGFVEYLGYGRLREIKIHTRERRMALQILHKIQKIYRKQVLPEKPSDAPCERCENKEVCSMTPCTLSSKFF